VRDYGPGVPDAQLTQLMRPFYRSDAARQNVAGTGLGLAIAVHMIEAMGCKLRIINANRSRLLPPAPPAAVRVARSWP